MTSLFRFQALMKNIDSTCCAIAEPTGVGATGVGGCGSGPTGGDGLVPGGDGGRCDRGGALEPGPSGVGATTLTWHLLQNPGKTRLWV